MSGTTDRIALVTGANKGIGFEVARGIARAGYVVLLAACGGDGADRGGCSPSNWPSN
jgi:NAD(P)-dependent dehydrogenase (short-subunit alcohol dehydrogenase family)